MPGPKLAVRLAVIAFGLFILGGAWLVSQSESPPPDPPATESPQPRLPD
jgi:hypothetical protein